jgi:hypothetical protein
LLLLLLAGQRRHEEMAMVCVAEWMDADADADADDDVDVPVMMSMPAIMSLPMTMLMLLQPNAYVWPGNLVGTFPLVTYNPCQRVHTPYKTHVLRPTTSLTPHHAPDKARSQISVTVAAILKLGWQQKNI